MFLDPEELKSVAYEYQISEITESDDDIPVMAIDAAVEEMKSYLTPNKDSRNQFDVVAIFSATGSNRNALILELCKSIALYYLCRLSNVDIIEQKVKDRYDRAIDWLEKVTGTGKSAGTNPIRPGLPMLPPVDENTAAPFRFGSRPKFDHEGYIG